MCRKLEDRRLTLLARGQLPWLLLRSFSPDCRKTLIGLRGVFRITHGISCAPRMFTKVAIQQMALPNLSGRCQHAQKAAGAPEDAPWTARRAGSWLTRYLTRTMLAGTFG